MGSPAARPGLLRPGSESLVRYAVAHYARNRTFSVSDKQDMREFSNAFCWGMEARPLSRSWANDICDMRWHAVPIEYLGVWDTVKAAGFLRLGNLHWPSTTYAKNNPSYARRSSANLRVRKAAALMTESHQPEWLRAYAEPPLWLRATVDELLDAWSVEANWQARQAKATTPAPIRLTGPISGLIDRMSSVPLSSLVVATNSPWTAMFGASGGRTPNAFTLAPLVPCEFARFHIERSDAAPDLGFYWYAAPATESEALREEPVPHRSVRSWREDTRWHFEQYGELLSFENVEAYVRTKRAERLEPADLSRYAEALGIPINNIGTYSGDAALLLPTAWPDPPYEHSTEEESRLTLEWQRMNIERLHAKH